jgi:hypothetical protein
MKRIAISVFALLASLQAPAQLMGSPGNVSYQGLWWNAPANSQSGWGINIAHQGNVLFATWFTYDTDGSGLWLVMPDMELAPASSMGDIYGYGGYGMMPAMPTYSGTIYRTSGPSFDAASFDSAKVAAQPVGVATFQFSGPDDGTFTSTVNGMMRSAPITREVFGPATVCVIGGAAPDTPNFTDLWYNAPADSERGWGVNLTQQGGLLFATWFTYDDAGKAAWMVMPRGEATGAQSWSGPIFRTTGPALGGPWDNAKVVATPVGTASFAFSGTGNGTFTATVGGQTIRKSIIRQADMTPPSTCR